MISTRSQIDKIIITAMDRFVWFVLLVVMSHLVTEFTRVKGYSRGNRHEVVLVNDSLLLQPMSVQNMVLYPGHEYGIYDRPNVAMGGGGAASNGIEPNAAFISGGVGGGGAGTVGSTNMAENNIQGFSFFSFRPLIDSIFEIPISTLRAVNNLVARLTGSYRQAIPDAAEKSAEVALPTTPNAHLRLPSRSAPATHQDPVASVKTGRKSLLREQLA